MNLWKNVVLILSLSIVANVKASDKIRRRPQSRLLKKKLMQVNPSFAALPEALKRAIRAEEIILFDNEMKQIIPDFIEHKPRAHSVEVKPRHFIPASSTGQNSSSVFLTGSDYARENSTASDPVAIKSETCASIAQLVRKSLKHSTSSNDSFGI